MTSLLQKLLSDPETFEFFAALRVIEDAFPDAPPIGYAARPANEKHRLGYMPTMAFAPGSVASAKQVSGKIDVESRVLGLLGPNGALPLHLTDYALRRQLDHHDDTLVAFLNIFHHRALSLFYRAWADAEPHANAGRDGTPSVGSMLDALLGIADEAVEGRDHFSDSAKKRHVNLFERQRRDADGLETVLAQNLGLDVKVQQFVGVWLDIPSAEYSRLGEKSVTLGQDATAGARVYHGAAKVRLVLGPLSLTEFEALLPGGEVTARFVACVRFYLGDEVDWDYQLLLKPDEVPRTELGSSGQLGWTTWSGQRRDNAPAGDAVLQPDLQSALREEMN